MCRTPASHRCSPAGCRRPPSRAGRLVFLSALLRHLVPVTGADVTALGTVLARLLLCSPTQDLQVLAELHHLTKEPAAATTAE